MAALAARSHFAGTARLAGQAGVALRGRVPVQIPVDEVKQDKTENERGQNLAVFVSQEHTTEKHAIRGVRVFDPVTSRYVPSSHSTHTPSPFFPSMSPSPGHPTRMLLVVGGVQWSCEAEQPRDAIGDDRRSTGGQNQRNQPTKGKPATNGGP